MDIYVVGLRPVKAMRFWYSVGMDLVELPIVDVVASTYEQRARDRIKSWIQSTNMTQAQVAVRIGKNQEWMSRYLSAKFDADFETLERLAAVFGHSLIALLDLPRDPQEGRLVEFYRALPPQSRTSLLDFLATFHPVASLPKSRS